MARTTEPRADRAAGWVKALRQKTGFRETAAFEFFGSYKRKCSTPSPLSNRCIAPAISFDRHELGSETGLGAAGLLPAALYYQRFDKTGNDSSNRLTRLIAPIDMFHPRADSISPIRYRLPVPMDALFHFESQRKNQIGLLFVAGATKPVCPRLPKAAGWWRRFAL